MRLALKSARSGWAALAQTLLAAVGSGFGALLVGLPGPAGEAPLGVLIALLAAVVIAPGLVSTWPGARTVPSRSGGAIALLLVLTPLAPALLVVAGFGAVVGPQVWSYAGVLLWLVAIQLTAGVLVSCTFQGAGPALYVLLCALFGRIDSAVQPWAWPLAGAEPSAAILLGALAFTLAGALLASIGLRPSSSHEQS